MNRAAIAVIATAALLAGCGDASGGDKSASATALPGGSTGKSVLREHSWLDDDGRLHFGEAAPADDVQAAICDYLFGTPRQVAKVAKLDGDLTLNADSGYATAGGGGTGFRCYYDVDDAAAFALRVWTQDADGSADASHVLTLELAPDRFGFSAYAPDHQGPTLSKATATKWLREAAGRVTDS